MSPSLDTGSREAVVRSGDDPRRFRNRIIYSGVGAILGLVDRKTRGSPDGSQCPRSPRRGRGLFRIRPKIDGGITALNRDRIAYN